MISKKQRVDRTTEALLPLVYLILVLWMEHMTPTTTITPFFGILGLTAMAFHLQPRWMTTWAFIYCITVLCVFFEPEWISHKNKAVPLIDVITPYLRSATFVAGAIMSIVLCHVLDRLRKANSDMRDILKKLSSPIITSDHDGRIHFMNEAAERIMGITAEEALGVSYFDLLAPKEAQGATISNYLRRFEFPDPMHPIKLESKGVKYDGQTQLMESMKPKLMMTILSENPNKDKIEII